MKRQQWTQARVSEGKSLAITRLLEVFRMPTDELQREVDRLYGQNHGLRFRESLVRLLVIEALDRAFPDSLTPKDPRP